ncbi:uncharacterized protein LOC107270450 [Cephus cinctus]|uniref:Uncharacterized protein LOC107270450 n=1 Tax=Cephus cinctus TaxID=211228 RepID=A0AAJ7C3E4_CEPCN|nr:uncharacterized protein LOC107270450 [Cephus cinctus]XP_015600967.1 uncharacterized protein LOC107270450 [Cephus cinctus]
MESSSSTEGSILFREIHMNGWLRRAEKSDKEVNRFWVVFCVHDDSEPRLEGFPDQKDVAAHSPTWTMSLRNALHLSPTLCATQRHDFEFCVNFNDDRVLRLAAPTYQLMYDWVRVVTRKLTDMKILKPKENVYSKGPERLATRDPTSPLPPPPAPTPGSSNMPRSTGAARFEVANVASTSSAIREVRADTTPSVFTFDLVAVEERRPRPQLPQRTPPIPSPRVIPNPSTDEENSSYESLFLATSYSPTGGVTRVLREPGSSESSDDHYTALIEYRSSPAITDNPRNHQTQAPGLSHVENSNANMRLTLRQQQFLELGREMNHPSGVRLLLGRRYCKDNIAFVDIFGAVYIAGWKRGDFGFSYNVLHVGDRVVSVAGVSVPRVAVIRNILKSRTTPYVKLGIRRLPHGRALLLNRRSDDESFGLEVNGNEVIGMSEAVQRRDVTLRTPAADPEARPGTTVSWTLTEVNGRPLNLFECTAGDRLSAVGRDISIVMQPSDLVTGLRKKLRAIRNYKQFVVQ